MAPTVSGTLIAINVTVGQHVNQGEVLAQVEPASQKQGGAGGNRNGGQGSTPTTAPTN